MCRLNADHFSNASSRRLVEFMEVHKVSAGGNHCIRNFRNHD
jgi:hypothetical protein